MDKSNLYTDRPKNKCAAQRAWDELRKKNPKGDMLRIWYDRAARTWVGVFQVMHGKISYWPRVRTPKDKTDG